MSRKIAHFSDPPCHTKNFFTQHNTIPGDDCGTQISDPSSSHLHDIIYELQRILDFR